MDNEDVTAALQDAFASLVEADEVDVEAGTEPGTVEVVAEAWTLHVEGWPDHSIAWLAIDEEPEDPKQIRAARAAAMRPEAIEALTRADAQTNSGIRAALVASDDPLSLDLAAALSTNSPPAPPADSPS